MHFNGAEYAVLDDPLSRLVLLVKLPVAVWVYVG